MTALAAVAVSAANTWTDISAGMVSGRSYAAINLTADRIDITESATSPALGLSYRWIVPNGGCVFMTFDGTAFWIRCAASTGAVQIIEAVS